MISVLIDEHSWNPCIYLLLVFSLFPFGHCTVCLNFPLPMPSGVWPLKDFLLQGKRLRCMDVRCRHWLERRKQLCKPCPQGLTCNGSGDAVGQKCFIFCLAPQTWGIKWTMHRDLFQRGNALLVHISLTVSPLGLSLSNAALAWDSYWCSPCCCYLCCSDLWSRCQWWFPNSFVSPEESAPQHIR